MEYTPETLALARREAEELINNGAPFIVIGFADANDGVFQCKLRGASAGEDPRYASVNRFAAVLRDVIMSVVNNPEKFVEGMERVEKNDSDIRH